MAHMERQFYILLVVEDGTALHQWAIKLDYLLGILAGGALCSISILAGPLFLLTR